MARYSWALIYIALVYFTLVDSILTNTKGPKKYPIGKTIRINKPYSWKGRIVGRPANKTHHALCLAANPDTLQLIYSSPVARRCPDMPNARDPWTDWEFRGMFQAPDRETFYTFTGFLYHPALDACMLYKLDTAFMADESPRGTMMLEPCEELRADFDKMPMAALNDSNARFLSKTQVPIGTELSDKKVANLERWVYPASDENTILLESDVTADWKDMIDLKDNTRTLFKKSAVCGRYMGMGQAGDGSWSLMADVELKEGKPWQWGCGSRAVHFTPSFLWTRL
ncbi:hypothetical protein TWF696_007818 [Orbilia brochopaga]|uniref:Uncharacterized protein n=1 Tax=Orbilia brochopaga TaxID=3140254 RepID=A0AAV9ULN7_9PEZI